MKKLYFLLIAMLVSLSASATGWYFNGALNGWAAWNETALADYQLKQTSTGIYELDLTTTSTPDLSGEFLIVSINGTSADWNTKISKNGSKGIVEGTAYSYSTGGSNLALDSSNSTIANAKITLNTTAKTITITGQSATNSFEVVYMVGDFGDGWSTAITTYPLEKTATDTYEGTYTISSTAANSDYFYTVPQCGTQTLQLSENVQPQSGNAYTLGSGTGAFEMTPGTYTFKVVADQAAESAVVTITSSSTPVVADKTLYWDNTDAKWAEVYAIVADDNGNKYDNGAAIDAAETSVENIWSVTVPGDYTKVVFTDGNTNSSSSYTIVDNYVYSLTNSGSAYEAPKDYSSIYVNIKGVFNTWTDNGVHPASNGISKHTNLAIGTSEFKVMIWDGSEHWYSTGGAIATDQWVSIAGDTTANMTISGAKEGEEFTVEYNVETNQIRVTSATPKDYTKLYVNIRGDFNSWKYDGVHPDENGLAICPAENVNTAFKVVVYDPDTDADTYYSTGAELTAGQWTTITTNIDPGMTLPTTLQEGAVTLKFDCTTGSLYVEKDTSSVDAIIATENVPAVYYNLQGVRVSNPVNGLYIVVRGDKVAKELVK
jgi:hypothetical protein